eukprot:jgi/Bigna1/81643/fgenesh1_pg.82_\
MVRAWCPPPPRLRIVAVVWLLAACLRTFSHTPSMMRRDLPAAARGRAAVAMRKEPTLVWKQLRGGVGPLDQCQNARLEKAMSGLPSIDNILKQAKPQSILSYLPDDEVEYRIYLDEYPPYLEGDSTLPAENVQAFDTASPTLQRVRREIMEFTHKWIKDYLWQREGFNLHEHVPSSSFLPFHDEAESAGVPHLVGRTKFGENIEDEWFIVWLLLAITRKFPQLTATVVDADGQFLLIEAAEVLPRLMRPEHSLHTTFIRNGSFVVMMPHVEERVDVDDDDADADGNGDDRGKNGEGGDITAIGSRSHRVPTGTGTSGMWRSRRKGGVKKKKRRLSADEGLHLAQQYYHHHYHHHHHRDYQQQKEPHLQQMNRPDSPASPPCNISSLPPQPPLPRVGGEGGGGLGGEGGRGRGTGKALSAEVIRRINEVLFARLHSYPAKVLEGHSVRMLLPLRVAHVLRACPQLLPLACRAFVERDEEGSLMAGRMGFFTTEQMVASRVRFTRCLFSQLRAQKYHAPYAFRRVAPIPSGLMDEKPAAFNLGMKVSVGMELLYLQQSLDWDPGWRGYEEKLLESGFYRKRQGSGEDYDLELQARIMYAKHRESRRQASPQPFLIAHHDDSGGTSSCKPKSSNESHQGSTKGKNASSSPASARASFNITELSLRFPTSPPRRLGVMDASDAGAAEGIPGGKQTRRGHQKGTDAGAHTGSRHQRDSISWLRDNETAVERIERFILEEKSGVDGIEAPGERAFFEHGRLNLPSDAESSLWSDAQTATSEAGMDIPRAAMKDYIQAMDEQLARHEGRADFERDPEDRTKVDLKYNLAKNWAAAYAAERGEPGPVSSVLNSLGLRERFNQEAPTPEDMLKRPNDDDDDGDDAMWA